MKGIDFILTVEPISVDRNKQCDECQEIAICCLKGEWVSDDFNPECHFYCNSCSAELMVKIAQTILTFD